MTVKELKDAIAASGLPDDAEVAVFDMETDGDEKATHTAVTEHNDRASLTIFISSDDGGLRAGDRVRCVEDPDVIGELQDLDDSNVGVVKTDVGEFVHIPLPDLERVG